MKRRMFTLAAVLALAGPAHAQTMTSGGADSMNRTQATTPTNTNETGTTNAPNPSANTRTMNSEITGTNTSRMSRTASPLPLVGASGLMSLAAGLWLYRRRDNT